MVSPFSLLHHPAFQSVVLPALAVLACLAALGLPRATRAWVPLAAPLGLALAWLVWPGIAWPAASQAQKLPWVALAALLAMALVTALPRSGAGRAWGLAALVWAAAAVWLLGGGAWPRLLIALGAGAAVLAVVASVARGSGGARVVGVLLVLALFGLAGAGALGGSLLLAQLAAMAGVATGVPVALALVRPATRPALAVTTLLPLATAALCLASLAALSLTAPATGAAGTEDPYYTPRW